MTRSASDPVQLQPTSWLQVPSTERSGEGDRGTEHKNGNIVTCDDWMSIPSSCQVSRDSKTVVIKGYKT